MRTLLPILALALAACDPDPLACEVSAPRVLASGPDTDAVIAGHNALALRLAPLLSEPGQDLFYSPISVSAALSMVLAGAQGGTATEIRDVLGITVGDDVHHQIFGTLLQDLDRSDPCLGTELALANGLFGQRGEPFDPGFITRIDEAYGAPLIEVDFDSDGRDTINAWVSEQTGAAIEELFGPGTLGPNPILVIANAIRFSGQWATGFEPEQTGDRAFTLSDGTSVQVPTMRQDHALIRLGEGEQGLIAALPYQGDELEMITIVPHDPGGLADVEAELAETLQDWLSLLGEPLEAQVWMPRFTIDDDAALHEQLPQLGLAQLFDAGAADLSGITAQAWIASMPHQATIAVDEVGTEAAAATGASVNVKSSAPEVAMDRPFVFLIRDRITGAVLFVGRLEDPR